MKQTILKAVNIEQDFGSTRVLDELNLEIYHGDFTVIMGPSGAGKSTLLYALSGMDAPRGGQVWFRDREIGTLSERQMCSLRAQQFGFVFQQTHLVSMLTIKENLLVAGYNAKKTTLAKVREKAENLLLQMGIAQIANHLPNEVSGGEAQRAAVARAMMNEPELLFADEPTGALNRANSEELLNIFTALHANGQDILMVTHDLKAAVRATRLLYLEDGRITGEYRMEQYMQATRRQREEAISHWLISQGW